MNTYVSNSNMNNNKPKQQNDSFSFVGAAIKEAQGQR
jgi:hypothetical protein